MLLCNTQEYIGSSGAIMNFYRVLQSVNALLTMLLVVRNMQNRSLYTTDGKHANNSSEGGSVLV